VNLDELRAALTELDGELLALVAKRQALSEQVAAVASASNRR
jgi:chorismate mutase